MITFSLKNIWMLLIFAVVILYLLLLYKDPFSDRTLIPNFEPQPDTFNYIDPALNLTKGKSFNLNREGRKRVQAVPPLYSFTLIPMFFLKGDPRMAYYANIILALVSLFFFWSILRRVFINKFVIFLLLILYISNYFIYWVPSLIMAENLTLTLFLVSFSLLLSKPVITNQILLAAFAIGMYATKYANIPLTFTIVLISLGKVVLDKVVLKQKIKLISTLLAAVLLFFSILAVFESITKGNNIFTQILEHLSSIERSIPKNTSSAIVSTSSWFGIQYVKQNLPLYINSLLGKPNRFLWDNTPLLPKFVAIAGLIGIFGNFFYKKFRFLALTLLLFISTMVIFMSTFYIFDARYIYIAIPTLLIGFGLFLSCIENVIGTNKKTIINLLILICISVYLIISFTRIRSQISLNFKYAETPWNYIAVLKMNEYFTADKIKDNKKPVLISALPPFLIDYYSNGNYTLLPLSYEQEFRGIKELVWGPNDYSDLPKLYKKYLNEGQNVYVSRAGLGNEGYTNRDFNTIVNEFDTKLVQAGCYDQCNIYIVKLKDENGN